MSRYVRVDYFSLLSKNIFPDIEDQKYTYAFVATWLVSALELATAMSSVAISTMNGNAFIIRIKINFGKSFIYFFLGGEGWGGSEIYSV